MIAQSHILMEKDGIYDKLGELRDVNVGYPGDLYQPFSKPTDVQRARAKDAYEIIRKKVDDRDLNSDNFIEDLLAEKAFKLDRFAEEREKKLGDDILEQAGQAEYDEEDDKIIKSRIK